MFKIYEDPNEKENVATDHPVIVDQMTARSEFVANWVREAEAFPRGRGGAAGEEGAVPADPMPEVLEMLMPMVRPQVLEGVVVAADQAVADELVVLRYRSPEMRMETLSICMKPSPAIKRHQPA